MISIALWKRDSAYYERNDWAGKLLYGEKFIFDSPLQNAMAHILQNLLFLTGAKQDASAEIIEVYGENYNAQPIESADTQFIRVRTKNGYTFSMAATHATETENDPVIKLIFEKGTVSWRLEEGCAVVRSKSGEVLKTIANGPVDPKVLVFTDTLDAIKNSRDPLCNIQNAMSHTLCKEALYRAMNPVRIIDDDFREDLIDPFGKTNSVIKGIREAMEDVYRTGKSFYELALPWAGEGKVINLKVMEEMI